MVSIVMPAYNAERTISDCLKSLAEQDFKGDYEVVVVDDGSTDSTPDISSRFENVRLIRQENAGPAAARNRGAKEAKGDIILFTDSDCVPEKDWVSQMMRSFEEDPDISGVKGRYMTRQKELVARFVQLEYEDKYDYMKRHKYIDFIDTYSAGFKKGVFLQMQGYDSEFPVACAEDVELSYRMSRQGHKMVFNPSAVVYHIHPNGLWDYLKKKYKFAYWRMLAVKKNPDKLVKDTHTPQLMKFQALLPPAVAVVLAAAALNAKALYLALALFALFMATTVPFTVKAISKDTPVGLVSPVLLFLRAAAQFLGIVGGAAYVVMYRKG
jgi:glycosyltransferase involved in cell wall biosynthesis